MPRSLLRTEQGTDAAVTVTALRKSYGRVTALDGLDLAIDAGEVFALLGPNGAGKTTAIEILEGHRRRDSGTVRVLGVDPEHADRRWRSRVGVVLQSTAEFEDLTVGEVVRHFSRYYPHSDDPAAVIDRVGLAEKANARTETLSGGQKRRLDVALGIIGRPELLFLDEPTTGFDPQARVAFWDLIRELSATGTTIVLTTHYLAEAEALADRVGVIAGGRLVAIGPPAELGGRDTAVATISWRGMDGSWMSVHTEAPSIHIAKLVAEYGGELPGLVVSRPSLEEVYLDMIGARLSQPRASTVPQIRENPATPRPTVVPNAAVEPDAVGATGSSLSTPASS